MSVGRSQTYSITCNQQDAFTDNSTLSLSLVNYYNNNIEVVTLCFKVQFPLTRTPPGQVAVDIHDVTTASEVCQRINAYLIIQPGNYIAQEGPVIVDDNTLILLTSVPDERTNSPFYNPQGTALTVGIVSATKDGNGSLPLVNLLSYVARLEALAPIVQLPSRGAFVGTLTNLNCDSRGGFDLTLTLKPVIGSGYPYYASILINGTSIIGEGAISSVDYVGAVSAPRVGIFDTNTAMCICRVVCKEAHSSELVRMLDITTVFYNPSTGGNDTVKGCGLFVTSVPTEIVSLGLDAPIDPVNSHYLLYQAPQP